jgi:hypothetical protein
MFIVNFTSLYDLNNNIFYAKTFLMYILQINTISN